MVAPSRDHSTSLIWSLCPANARNESPVLASHVRTIPSTPPVAMAVPSGENVAHSSFVVWRNTNSSRPDAASQIRAVPSSPDVTTRLLSGENRAESTIPT